MLHWFFNLDALVSADKLTSIVGDHPKHHLCPSLCCHISQAPANCLTRQIYRVQGTWGNFASSKASLAGLQSVLSWISQDLRIAVESVSNPVPKWEASKYAKWLPPNRLTSRSFGKSASGSPSSSSPSRSASSSASSPSLSLLSWSWWSFNTNVARLSGLSSCGGTSALVVSGVVDDDPFAKLSTDAIINNVDEDENDVAASYEIEAHLWQQARESLRCPDWWSTHIHNLILMAQHTSISFAFMNSVYSDLRRSHSNVSNDIYKLV